MTDEEMTKEQLISKLAELRQRNLELEAANKDHLPIFTVPEPSLPKSRFSESFVSFNNGIQQPVENSKKYHISDLIDINLLQQLLDSFYELTGINHSFLDVDNNFLSSSGWTNICLKFHRACPQTEHRCKQSDSYISDHLADGPYIRYRCLNGLLDYATPIIVEGQHLATIYMGQLLNEPPNEEYFCQQAQQFGFDEEAYIEALQQVNIVPEHKIEPIMNFYSKLGQVMASMGLERLRRIEAADEVILEREERLRLVLEASNDGFWDWNIETGEMYWSHRWAQILGCSPDDVEPNFQAWEESVHPEDINTTMKELNEYLDGRIPKYESEYRLLTKSGEWKWIMARGKVVARNEQGKPVRMVGTCIDITDRKLAESALRFSEGKFSKAFHCSPDVITITTFKEGRYIEVNDAYLNLIGYERHEVIGYTVTELGIWYVPAERDRMLKQIQEKGKIRNLETHFNTKTNGILTTLFSADTFDMNGETYLLCVAKDITERKKMEQEMARLDRLNLVGEMAASIGHEIRNPMTSVRGFLQMFENKYSEDKEFLNLMIDELDRANAIITEFLSLAKNKMVELVPQDLNLILKNILPLVQASATIQDKSIKMELESVPVLLLDQKEIRQLIINLVHNGLESMSVGGIMTVRTYKEGESVVLSIRDQGHGMNPQVLDKLGTPFFTTKEKGTGLGMAVCYGIANRHGASIDIVTGDKGTIVSVRFPL